MKQWHLRLFQTCDPLKKKTITSLNETGFASFSNFRDWTSADKLLSLLLSVPNYTLIML
jgi:hypothetical protein